MSDAGPVALVTGGARGIGLGIAECLAADGCRLALNGTRPESDVAEVLEKLKQAGTDVCYCRGDVADALELDADQSVLVDRGNRARLEHERGRRVLDYCRSLEIAGDGAPRAEHEDVALDRPEIAEEDLATLHAALVDLSGRQVRHLRLLLGENSTDEP